MVHLEEGQGVTGEQLEGEGGVDVVLLGEKGCVFVHN